MEHSPQGAALSRRRVLRFGAAAAACAVIARPSIGRTLTLDVRSLRFANTHTGETLSTIFWENGRYLQAGLQQIDHILRDFRNDQTMPIDRRLLDLLTQVHARLETDEPFEIISGYRSPETNAMLAAASDGVAKHSLHMEGKAIDIRIQGRSIDQIQAAGLSLAEGGVGLYRKSDFVHLDVGRVRAW